MRALMACCIWVLLPAICPILAVAQAPLVIAYPGDVMTSVRGINDRGTVAGYYISSPGYTHQCPDPSKPCPDGYPHLFIYSNGKFKGIQKPLPEDIDTVDVVGINNNDQVLVLQNHIGYFLYDIARDSYSRIGPIGRNISGTNIHSFSIGEIKGLNDKGEIVFTYNDSGIAYGVPALGAPGSKVVPTEARDFTGVPGCRENFPATPAAINNNDQIVGSCHLGKAFLYSGGNAQLFTAPDAAVTKPVAINNKGTVIGVYQAGRKLPDGRVLPEPTLRVFLFNGTTAETVDSLPDQLRRFQPQVWGGNNKGRVVINNFIVTLPGYDR